jgi:hypothetical protein
MKNFKIFILFFIFASFIFIKHENYIKIESNITLYDNQYFYSMPFMKLFFDIKNNTSKNYESFSSDCIDVIVNKEKIYYNINIVGTVFCSDTLIQESINMYANGG